GIVDQRIGHFSIPIVRLPAECRRSRGLQRGTCKRLRSGHRGAVAELPDCCHINPPLRLAGRRMADFTIYLGNKNYSSWSLRPWLVLKQTRVAFDEIVIPLYEPTSKATIMKYSPSGTVPAWRHGDLVVW